MVERVYMLSKNNQSYHPIFTKSPKSHLPPVLRYYSQLHNMSAPCICALTIIVRHKSIPHLQYATTMVGLGRYSDMKGFA